MFYHFPSIGSFTAVRHNNDPKLLGGPVTYRAKVKLHGTNGGVQVRSKGVFAQSRNGVLGVGTGEGHGFADWVHGHRDYFASLYNGEDFVIFGEWCGPGIMKKTAVNKIPRPVFAVFAMQYGLSDDPKTRLVHDPITMAEILGCDFGGGPDVSRWAGRSSHQKEGLRDMYVLPPHGDYLVIDFADTESMRTAVEAANAAVAEVEACDPWVKATFGVEGIGEGLVYYPIGVTVRPRFSNLAWKAKGEHHKVVRSKESVQIAPEVLASIDAFVAMFVTEARLEQGVEEIGRADPRLTGPFLAWVCRDVEKESVAERSSNGLEWKPLAKAVSTAARKWFLQKANTIC